MTLSSNELEKRLDIVAQKQKNRKGSGKDYGKIFEQGLNRAVKKD